MRLSISDRFAQSRGASSILDQSTHTTMPHKEDGSKLEIVQLHPTFAAEVRGVDFSQDISPDVFDEIHAAITKVSKCLQAKQGSNQPLKHHHPSTAWSSSQTPASTTLGT